jgi:hypothetical protein
MSSAIDATKPVTGTPTTQSVRDNFAAAKSEIEALQLAKVWRVLSANESVSITQYCAVANTPQVIAFNSELYKNPNTNAVFEFDSVNNEFIFHETGWYDCSLIVQGIRQTSGAPVIDWNIHAQLKVPSGSFTNFGASSRKKTFDGGSAAFKEFFTLAFIAKIEVAGTRLRWMQTATDATKDTGIISYPAAGSLPSAAGATFSVEKIGAL